jgi:FkbM family methyltransferase
MADRQIKKVEHGKHVLRFIVDNSVTEKRVRNFHTKEPDTLAWIEKFNSTDLFIDVGANVGTYTIFAAIVADVDVIAFEPESGNYQRLIDNCIINEVDHQVRAFSIALSDHLAAERLFVRSSAVGGSLHSIDGNFGYDGLPMRQLSHQQSVVGMRLDRFPLPPELEGRHWCVKIDVDGLEHLVVNGMLDSLDHIKSILVECNHNLDVHKKLLARLYDRGYRYDAAQADRARRRSGPMAGVGNVIFDRM